MRIEAAIWSLLVLAAACGDDAVDDDGVESGSRLRAVYLTAGSARHFVGFYDRERDERCTFTATMGSEESRCTPAAIETRVFTDPACTIPAVWIGDESCEPPRYARRPSSPCDPDQRIWTVSKVERLPIVYRLESPSGACEAILTTGQDGWYAGDAPVPAEAFAQGDVHLTPGPDRLRQQYVRSRDGARQPVGIVDDALQSQCTFADEAGGFACAPRACAYGGFFWSDETCSSPLVTPVDPESASWCGCGPPRFAAASRFYEVAERVASPTAIYASGDLNGERVCTLQTSDPGELYRVGEELELVHATPTITGDGRIRTRVLVAPGAITVAGFFDDTRGASCAPALASDGARRCLPAGEPTWMPPAFSDPACTVPVRVVAISDREPVEPRRVAIADRAPVPPSCRPARSVYALGAELAPETIYAYDQGGECTPFYWDAMFDRIYLVGDEVDPSQFAKVEEVTE